MSIKIIEKSIISFEKRQKPRGHKAYSRMTPTGKIAQIKEKPYVKENKLNEIINNLNKDDIEIFKTDYVSQNNKIKFRSLKKLIKMGLFKKLKRHTSTGGSDRPNVVIIDLDDNRGHLRLSRLGKKVEKFLHKKEEKEPRPGFDPKYSLKPEQIKSMFLDGWKDKIKSGERKGGKISFGQKGNKYLFSVKGVREFEEEANQDNNYKDQYSGPYNYGWALEDKPQSYVLIQRFPDEKLDEITKNKNVIKELKNAISEVLYGHQYD